MKLSPSILDTFLSKNLSSEVLEKLTPDFPPKKITLVFGNKTKKENIIWDYNYKKMI